MPKKLLLILLSVSLVFLFLTISQVYGAGWNNVETWSFNLETPPEYVTITLTTNPSGLNVRLDGGAWYASPKGYIIVNGTSHSIECQSPQSGGTGKQYVWTSWSDAGANPHSVAPTVNASYTATYKTQYYFAVASARGSPTGEGWYDSGTTTVHSTVTSPSGGYVTTGWTGTGSLMSGGTRGSTDTGTFTITAYTTCTWNWELMAWHGVETWTFNLNSVAVVEPSWHNVEAWAFNLNSALPVGWHSVEVWTFNLNSVRSWYGVEAWTFSLNSTLLIGWNNVENWNFTLTVTFEIGWHTVETWSFKISSAGSRYVVHGPYYENGAVADCITNMTLYSKTFNPYPFILNGTDGVADTVTLDVEGLGWYFSWNASATGTRSYYLSATIDEIWVFVADPTKTYDSYTISFLDLAGVLKTMPYVKVQRYVDGMKTIERQKVDLEKKVAFYLETWAAYTVVLEDTTTSYTFGDLLLTDARNIVLTLKAVDFPKATLFTYKYVRVYGERMLGSPNGTVTVTYQDTLNMTVGVTVYVTYKNGSNATPPTTYTTNSFVHTWNSASNDTDYAVTLAINHQQYGVYSWKQYFPRSFSIMPWGMAWLGTAPFNTAYILPAFLVIFAGACFSVVNAPIGAFMMVIMAVVEAYMGWLPISSSVLVVAFTFAVIMAIIYAKRKIQS